MDEYDFSELLEEEASENPRRKKSRMNAGRHFRGSLGGESTRVRAHGAHYGGPASRSDMLAMTKDELVADGGSEAIAELARRGRGPDGVKLAWGATSGKSKAPKLRGAAPQSKGAKGRPSNRSAIMKRAVELRAQGHSPQEALQMAWAGKNPRRTPESFYEGRRVRNEGLTKKKQRRSQASKVMKRARELHSQGHDRSEALRMAWAENK